MISFSFLRIVLIMQTNFTSMNIVATYDMRLLTLYCLQRTPPSVAIESRDFVHAILVRSRYLPGRFSGWEIK